MRPLTNNWRYRRTEDRFNTTCALLQTTGGKDVPNIVLIRHAPSYKQLEVKTYRTSFKKTCALLKTTGGKDEPNIILIRHAPSYKQLEVKTYRTSF